MFAGGGLTGAYGDSQAVHNMLGSLWSTVSMEAPPLEEQLQILLAFYPSLPPEVAAGGVASLCLCRTLAGAASGETGGLNLPPGWDSVVEEGLIASDMRPGELASAFGRHFSLRDLFHVCARMQASSFPTLVV